jgi:preprotein translocase subunit SecE
VQIKKDKMRIGAYIKDSFNELLHKVTWPTWDELQNSAVVVAIASLIIALIVYIMDTVFSELMQLFYSFFS